MDCSLPGSYVYGIPQAGMLESETFLSPGALSNTGIGPRSPALLAESLWSEPPGNQLCIYIYPLVFGFAHHLGRHRALSRLPRAVEYVLISYPFHT